jgi:hypothetical protein
MKQAFSLTSTIVQAWLNRLPQQARENAGNIIRLIELILRKYTFELEEEDDGAGVWFLKGQREEETLKDPHPFVSLEHYEKISIALNIFFEAEGGLHVSVEWVDEPNIQGWRIYAGEDLERIQDRRYLELRSAMYETRGSLTSTLTDFRADMIAWVMMESLDAP